MTLLPPSLFIAYSSLPDSASPEFEDTSSADAPAATPAWGASAWGASGDEPSKEGEGSESGETVRQAGGAEDSGYLSPGGGGGGGGGKDEELESWKNEEELSAGVKGLGVGGGKAQSGW